MASEGQRRSLAGEHLAGQGGVQTQRRAADDITLGHPASVARWSVDGAAARLRAAPPTRSPPDPARRRHATRPTVPEVPLMAWFRRREADDLPQTPPPDPDPVLPVLSREDAARLVALTRHTFAEHGRETVPDGQGALVGQGHVHGLSNLAATVSLVPRREWPGLVRRHVATMLQAHETEEPADLDAARDLLLVKLRAAAEIPSPRPLYAPEVLPGVLAVAALDYPTHVSELLSDERVDELGGWEAVREVAWSNLRRLPAPARQDLHGDPDRQDGTVHVLTTEDFFGASRLLLLDELLAGMGVERPAHGVLLVVPNRHLLAVHVLRGPGVVAAVDVLVRMAAGEHAGRPGPVSPHVYFRAADGRTQQVTSVEDDGSTAVHVEGALAEAFTALGLLGD